MQGDPAAANHSYAIFAPARSDDRGRSKSVRADGHSVTNLIPAATGPGQKTAMVWKSIRLELAGTRDFPNGSASRCYILRIPLDEDGYIVPSEIKAAPRHAVVRRFWPNEAEMAGYVIPTQRGWGFTYRRGDEGEGPVFQLETHPMTLGARISVMEPDGRVLPFRVASVQELV